MTTHISFGSETGDISPLKDIAKILGQEPPGFVSELKSQLKKGNSYPRARSYALEAYIRTAKLAQGLDWQTILSLPNNILAVEYLRALFEDASSLVPVTIPRIGPGYHQTGNSKFASATAIRDQIKQDHPLNEIQGLPPFTQEILKREFVSESGPVSAQSMFNLIRFSLSRMSTDDLRQIYDIGEGLENRIQKTAPLCSSREDLIAAIKTRRYSYTRISRILLYILLQFTQDFAAMFDDKGPQYLRLLGFSPQGQKILHDMKAISAIPVITKLGKGLQYSDPLISKMISFDCLATDLHALMQPCPGRGGLDFICSPVQVQG